MKTCNLSLSYIGGMNSVASSSSGKICGGGQVRFWVQENDVEGQPCFRQRYLQDLKSDEADAFIARERQRDEDLWVLILENSDGDLPPVLQAAKER